MIRNKSLALCGAAMLLATPAQAFDFQDLDRLLQNWGFTWLSIPDEAPTAEATIAAAQTAATQTTSQTSNVQPTATVTSASVSEPYAAKATASAPESISVVQSVSQNSILRWIDTAMDGLEDLAIRPGAVTSFRPTVRPVAPTAPTFVDTVAEVVEDIVDTVVDTVTGIVDTITEAVDAITGSGSGVETNSPGTDLKDEAEFESLPSGVNGQPETEATPEPVPVPEADSAKFSPTVTVVSNAAELKSALLSSLQTKGGMEIRVNPGNYGVLGWAGKDHSAIGRLYLIANTNVRPVFTKISIPRSKNIAIAGMQISGDERATVYMNSAENIIFSGNLMTGVNRNLDAWDDNNTGIHVRWAKNITLNDNVFEDLKGGVYFQQASKITFEYNTLHYIREGVNVAATDDLDLNRNLFRDFQPNIPNGEHPDSIQFWTAREDVGSTNVRMIENVMLHGGCAAVQGIFIGNERASAGVRYVNFTIQRNIYYGATKNAIALSGIDGALVENNVVVPSPYSETGVSRAEAQAKDPRCSGALRPAILSRGSNTASHTFRRNITGQMGSTEGVKVDNIEVGSTVGQRYETVFAARPTGEAPAISAFRTLNPSDARNREIGLLSTSFDYGASLTGRRALDRGIALHKK